MIWREGIYFLIIDTHHLKRDNARVVGDAVQGYPSVISMITILGGAQLLSIGLLGEYIGKTYYETKQLPVYLVRDVVQ